MSTICESKKAQPILETSVFEEHLAQFDDIPWLQDIKNKYWKQFNELDLPAKNDERWRFTSLSRIKLDACNTGSPAKDEDKAHAEINSNLISESAASVIFLDNSSIREIALSDDLKKQGVIFEPLSSAFRNHADLLKKYYFADPKTLGADKFLALQAAYCSNGTFLYVPKNVNIEKPVIAYNWASSSDGSLFPHTLIAAEDNASASLIDYYGSTNDSAATIFGLSTLQAGSGARVSRTAIQNLNKDSQAFQVENVIAGRDATTKSISINLGGIYSRLETRLDITGAGAEANIYALTVGVNKQEFDQRTLQVHSAPNAVSNLLYKNALLDDSRTIFSGMIKVDECAQQTDAYQTNRNLLLSDTAAANSLPGLEILANDVKCSHGATTARLSEDEIFYLRSRGIPTKVAQRLLVFGFFEEIFEKTCNEELADSVRQLTEEKFDASEIES